MEHITNTSFQHSAVEYNARGFYKKTVTWFNPLTNKTESYTSRKPSIALVNEDIARYIKTVMGSTNYTISLQNERMTCAE